MQNFKKTIIQIKAIKLLATAAIYIMLYGGSRSGKTFIIVYAIIVRASKKTSRHVMLRKTFNSIKTSIWMDTLPKVIDLCFPDLKESWQCRNKSDYVWTLPNGSEVWIAGLDDDKRVEKILGKEYSTMFFNEASELSFSSVEIALSRLAENSGLEPKAYFDENPPTKKHWSYWQWIKLLNPVESTPLPDSNDYASMLMNPMDNEQNLSKGYLKRLSGMSEDKRQRFLMGEFADGSDGEAYYAFNREMHVKETKLLKEGSLFMGMDFNVNPMTCVIGQFYSDKFYIHDEIFLENSDTFKMVDALIRKGYRGTVIPDSTGKNRKTSGKSDHRILKEAGFQIPHVFNPFVTDRVNNINRLFTDNRIIINPKCKKLIGDLEKVSWKDNKLDQKTDSMLTHISDALGYLCWKLDPIRPTSNTKPSFS